MAAQQKLNVLAQPVAVTQRSAILSFVVLQEADKMTRVTRITVASLRTLSLRE